MKRDYLTVQQLAERWGVSKAHVRRLYVSGEVKTLRLGRVVRIPMAEVVRLEKKATTSTMGVAG